MSVFLGGLSALLYGMADFAGGYATRKNRLPAVLAVSQAAGSLLALVFILAGRQPLPDPQTVAWGLAAGVSGLFGLAMLYRGIARSLVSLVSPLSALVGTLLPVAFGLFRGESPAPLALAGAALCIPAIVLLGWEKPGHASPGLVRASILHGLLAGLGFGGFFLALAQTGPRSGLWPVLIARGSSLLLVLLFVLLKERRLRLEPGSAPVTIGAGLADMGANIAFLLAARGGLLSLTAILSSVYPAPTVILARIVLKERIPPARIAGILMAIASIALIALP